MNGRTLYNLEEMKNRNLFIMIVKILLVWIVGKKPER